MRIESILIKRRNFSIRAEGNSMLPILRSGDVVHIRKKKFNNLKVDDIIYCSRKGKYFIHRIIYVPPQKKFRYVITKGDNNRNTDGRISPSNYMGTAVKIRRSGRIFDIRSLYVIQSGEYLVEINRITSLFRKNGLEHLLLKGLPLHLWLNNKLPSRIYADCDLMVRHSDFRKVREVFLEDGYLRANRDYSPFHRILRDKETEVSFFKRKGTFNVVFDVHFEPNFLLNQLGKLDHIYPQRLLDEMTEDFMSDKRCISVNGQEYDLLSDNDLFIYLCLHFFHHNCKGAYRLELIKNLILKRKLFSRTKRADIIRKIRNYRIEGFVYPVLLNLRKYFGISDRKIISEIYPGYERASYASKLRGIFRDETGLNDGISRFKNLFNMSPITFQRRIIIFLNPQVLFSFAWILVIKLLFRFKKRSEGISDR